MAAFFTITERFLEQVALRDGEALIRARAKGPIRHAIDEYPDIAEAYRRALDDPEEHARVARESRPPLAGEIYSASPEGGSVTRTVVGSPQLPLFSVDAPAPLQREGSERIIEATRNKNPLPERGLTADELSRYWAWALKRRAARQAQLEQPGDFSSPGYSTWRKERRIQIAMIEGVLELLHRIVAKDARYLCGADCNHLGQGLDPVQLKRFTDSLDVYRACTDYESEENYTAQYCHDAIEDLLAGKLKD
jgi:hypothetical protein